ncbi:MULTISPECIES: peptidase inhibitor family I36 protein [unclassified Streptomyces]|uniref:peptidase inhibitor family I36 protein n=1 Tax=unclassified Streptomyces TaxID=2593676 RepID=UPI00278BD5CB|nr:MULTISPECIES: peptidase inhibitor family I36 protein [unclassified Streptomyces]
MIRKVLAVAAAGLLTFGVASTAEAGGGTGPAEPGARSKADCPRGYVCVWNNTSFSGKPKWKSKGNLYDLKSSKGVSIFNNGWASPGADHIRFKYTWPHGSYGVGCLHYPPDGDTTTQIGEKGTLNYAKWGGEC